MGCARLGKYLCSQCVNKLRINEVQVCPMCGKPSVYGLTHARCKKIRGMDGLVSIFKYQGVARELVRKIKYQLVRDMYGDLVEAMVSMGEFVPLEKKEWLVVGVPLHKRRLRERGFNQADELAKRIGQYMGWKCINGGLERIRYTIPQVKLKGADRKMNVRGAFGISCKMQATSNKLKGRSVLLVDDVWTTGATMRECAKVLKSLGVKEVWGVVVAS